MCRSRRLERRWLNEARGLDVMAPFVRVYILDRHPSFEPSMPGRTVDFMDKLLRARTNSMSVPVEHNGGVLY